MTVMTGGWPSAYRRHAPGTYPIYMTTLTPSPAHRKAVAAAIVSVLTPAELTMVHQFMAAERPGRPAPQPEDVLAWVRLNMPAAAVRLEHVLYPAD